MSQVAQGLFQLNSENLHKQRFYSVFRKLAAVRNQPPCKIFLTSNWNFSCFPRHLWEVRDFLFFSNLTLDDGGLQFSAPFTHLFYTNSISLTLHTGYMLLPLPQPPQGSLYRGGFSCPREPRKLCIVTPDVSQKHLSREQGPSLTCWQPRCAWPFPVPWHVAGLALLVATGTFRCCSAATQRLQLALPPMHNSEFAAPELVEVPLSALVFLSFLRNEVWPHWFRIAKSICKPRKWKTWKNCNLFIFTIRTKSIWRLFFPLYTVNIEVNRKQQKTPNKLRSTIN